ncbi:MAG: tetratricopeptide repeat protein [Syntrophobacterales bacterium]|nr:tetratricopeptide repeat protein [Syntrophobacterales bacterium]
MRITLLYRQVKGSYEGYGRVISISLILWICLSVWAAPGLTQEQRFEQYSPQEEDHWKQMIQRNPRDSRAYYHLGRHYEFTRRIPLAAEAFHQATVLDPGWPQAFFSLGKAYRELNRYQEAAVALERAVLLKSDYARAYQFLGLVKIDLARYEEAAEALLKAYTCDPGWAETYYDNTTYGIHLELRMDKEVTLRLIRYIYPHNQHLARLLYNHWARGNAAMNEYYEAVAGPELPPDQGYQQGPIMGYRDPDEAGYQRPKEAGYQRRASQRILKEGQE